MSIKNYVNDPRRIGAIKIRQIVEAEIRNFFLEQGFLETRTPLLVASPGMEAHINPFKLTTGAYLPTSPEFAMKRLLVGGLEKIFQICPAFRNEPKSNTHNPEFTLLEFYRAKVNELTIQKDTENLFLHIAKKLTGATSIRYQDQTINLTPPWPRFKIRNLFKTHTGIILEETQSLDQLKKSAKKLGITVTDNDSWDDIYFKIWLNCIEQKLPKNKAVFVEDYPASQASLAIIENDENGFPWAKRFEIYVGGLELGNAFRELCAPEEYRKRFIKEMETRKAAYANTFPPTLFDENFLNILKEGLPPSSGIAIGVDRLIMLFADEPNIEYTFWLPTIAEQDN